jgi:hypothetical protein
LRKIALLLLAFSDVFLIVGLALFGYGITHFPTALAGTPGARYNYDEVSLTFGLLSVIGGATFLLLAYKKR